jgi:hypothetical protein
METPTATPSPNVTASANVRSRAHGSDSATSRNPAKQGRHALRAGHAPRWGTGQERKTGAPRRPRSAMRRRNSSRCAAATTANSEPHASMKKPTRTGARRRGAPQTRRSSRLQRGLRSGRAARGRLWNASCAAFASPLAPAPYRAGHIRSGALRRLGTARRRPASHLRVQRRAAHTLHRLPFTSSCWTRWKPAAAHRARRQAHGDAPPPHGSLIALTFARGGVALRLAACSRSLAGRLPGPARKARGRRPRLPGRLPRTLLGRRSHRSRCGSTLIQLSSLLMQDARAKARANSG